MSKVIVFASGKGGTGKSSVCVGTAISLTKKNNKVLLIDCDCGMRGLDLLLGIEGKLVFDASDIVKGNCSYKAAVYEHGEVRGLYLLPAPLDVEDEISPGIMRQMVSELKQGYDYILIDAPAGVGSSFFSAAVAADMALVIINTEPSGMRGCENVRKRLKAIGVPDIRLVINKFNKNRFRTLGIYQDLDEIIDLSGIRLIGIVPEDFEFVNMLQQGKCKYSNCEAFTAFDAIAARIEGETLQIAVKI